MYCDLWSEYIKVRKLFKGGNYSRKYGMLKKVVWSDFLQNPYFSCGFEILNWTHCGILLHLKQRQNHRPTTYAALFLGSWVLEPDTRHWQAEADLFATRCWCALQLYCIMSSHIFLRRILTIVVIKFQNKLMKSLFLPKYERKIVGISAL